MESERIHGCDQCVKRFRKKGYLKIHKFKVRRGELKYKCKQCNKSFSFQLHLQKHERLHTLEKIYKCNICEKSYFHSKSLYNHKLVDHSTLGPIKCDICNKLFKTKYTLKKHSRIHSAQRKSYNCDQCQKPFITVKGLANHKRIHSSEQPFKCDQCSRSFALKSSFKNHEKSCLKKVVQNTEKFTGIFVECKETIKVEIDEENEDVSFLKDPLEVVQHNKSED